MAVQSLPQQLLYSNSIATSRSPRLSISSSSVKNGIFFLNFLSLSGKSKRRFTVSNSRGFRAMSVLNTDWNGVAALRDSALDSDSKSKVGFLDLFLMLF